MSRRRQPPPDIAAEVASGRLSTSEAEAFLAHLDRVERDVYGHDLIRRNPYTAWFRQGTASTAQVIDLIEQFSVFSNYFIPLEAKRMVNAATEDDERDVRSILGNEIGVPIDVRTGNIEGFKFSHEFAHIKWLRDIGETLGLDRNRLGKWNIASESTRRFLEHLEAVYGSPDNNVGSGASFAIESWAGFGIGKGPDLEGTNFWKELVLGLNAYNARNRQSGGLEPLDVGFFQHHFDLELGHVASVEHELASVFFRPDFVAEAWYRGAGEALDAMLIFWRGLADSAKRLSAA